MHRRFISGLLMFAALSALPLNAQVEVSRLLLQAKESLYQATNRWDEKELIRARSMFERLLMQKRHLALVHYYIGLADYRLSSRYYMQNSREALKFLDDGIQHLEKAIGYDSKFADAYALLATLYGQKIGLEPAATMELGPQSWTLMETALHLQPDNPRVRMLKAVSTYYTPEQYGGSREKGKSQLIAALSLFEKESPNSPLQPDWGYEEALSMLATWYIESEKPDSALYYAQKAIQINPEYGWARTLMDSLNQKNKKQ
jgi:tetratricopeptide (TPR) repeat protein